MQSKWYIQPIWLAQGLTAAVFAGAGMAKLVGIPYMIILFDRIGLGQTFRLVTGTLELIGAGALLIPGLACVAALGLSVTMLCAAYVHVYILNTSPFLAVGLLAITLLIAWKRRDGLLHVRSSGDRTY